jgi:glucan 1,3-beta-glucosidase
VTVNQAADWTYTYYDENDVQTCQAATNTPSTYIAETGWPTASMTPANATFEGAVAGDSELQVFLECVHPFSPFIGGGGEAHAESDQHCCATSTFVCQANANGTQYFYFGSFSHPRPVSSFLSLLP